MSQTELMLRCALALMGAAALSCCGSDQPAPTPNFAIAGTYHVDVEKTVRQAAEMWLVHEWDWKAATTDSARAKARAEYERRLRERLVASGVERMTLRDDGAWEWEVDSATDVPPLPPRRISGRWHLSGDVVTIITTHADGKPTDVPFQRRRVYVQGSLYVHLDEIEAARGARNIGEWTEDDTFVFGMPKIVWTKE